MINLTDLEAKCMAATNIPQCPTCDLGYSVGDCLCFDGMDRMDQFREVASPDTVLKLIETIRGYEEALKLIASFADGHPANSEYDKGLKAAHDALGSKARQALAKGGVE
jgi:hypothetical protein